MAVAQREAQAKTGSPADTFLIDTDVHETIRSQLELRPYLPAQWQLWMQETHWPNGLRPGHHGYSIPSPKDAHPEWSASDGTKATDVKKLAQDLFEGEGVTHAILNGFFHMGAHRVQYDFMAALASAYNDWQIAEWLEQDERIYGSVHISLHDPVAAAREIDRVAEHPRIVQVFLPTVTDREYGDPFFWPIYEAAVRNGLVVTMHHGDRTTPSIGLPRYFIEWHTLAAPQAAAGQLTCLMFNGVFDKFPDLKVCFLETGVAWLPWLMWRLDQQYRELRLEVPWVKRLPSDHIRDSVRISTQPMSDVKPQHFAQLVEMAEAERVFMFSTDYPHYDADIPDHVLPKSLGETLRQRIRYLNAVETFPRFASLRS